MDYFTVKKLSEKYKIDFYQFISYLEYLDIPVEIENKIKVISEEHLPTIDKFVTLYNTNQIAYIKAHSIKPFFEGTLLLDLRKKYNLNEKQFKTKCANANLEFKYVYSDSECQKFDDFMNKTSNLNRAELRDLKYVKEGWIPLRDIFDEFGKKYDFCENTGTKILEHLNIEIYKPFHQLAFLNKEQKNKLENFLKRFNSVKERRLFFQEQTCIEKYGVSNPSQAQEARNKISETVQNNIDERIKKYKKTCLEKYGVENIFQTKEFIEKNKQYNKNEIEYIHSINGILTNELVIRFNRDYTTIVRILEKLGIKQSYGIHYFIYEKDLNILKKYCEDTDCWSISHAEKELLEFIKSIYSEKIIENSKHIISPFEIDIYIPEKKVAIEFDGIYWHSELYKDKNYHLRKTLACNEKGIDLIHVFEDDWLYKKEIVKSMIASRLDIYQKRIFARKCNIEKIKKEQAKDFFNKNHLQGFTYGDLYLGLIINNELVQCICINKKGWHDGNVELTRMVTKLNTQVIGGFSKLMSHIDEYIEYDSISSYIHRAWFNGNGYLKVGFKIVKENPCSYYYVVENKKVHKSHFRRARIKKFYRQGYLKYYDENKTEHENMLDNHIYRIYDCGTIKVIYSKNKK